MFRKTTGAIRKNTGPNIENDPVVSTWFIKTTQKNQTLAIGRLVAALQQEIESRFKLNKSFRTEKQQ